MSEHPVFANWDLARRIAAEAHLGHTDKIGQPYIDHPRRVAFKVSQSGGTWVQEQAAWLHDVLEDTSLDVVQLANRGVVYGVLEIVNAMTRMVNESLDAYYLRLLGVPGARLVKLCDVYDNLDPARMCYLSDEVQTRLRHKYAHALEVLA